MKILIQYMLSVSDKIESKSNYLQERFKLEAFKIYKNNKMTLPHLKLRLEQTDFSRFNNMILSVENYLDQINKLAGKDVCRERSYLFKQD